MSDMMIISLVGLLFIVLSMVDAYNNYRYRNNDNFPLFKNKSIEDTLITLKKTLPMMKLILTLLSLSVVLLFVAIIATLYFNEITEGTISFFYIMFGTVVFIISLKQNCLFYEDKYIQLVWEEEITAKAPNHDDKQT